MILAAYVLLEQVALHAFLQAAVALAAVAVGTCGFYFTQLRRPSASMNGPRWLRQGAWGGLSSACWRRHRSAFCRETCEEVFCWDPGT